MNSLSWLLYLGGVTENLGWLLSLLGLLLMGTCVGFTIYHFAKKSMDDGTRQELESSRDYAASRLAFLVDREDARSKEQVPGYERDKHGAEFKLSRLAKAYKFNPLIALAGVTAIVLWVSAALCPSQDTVYAIAASQTTEQVINSPLGAKAAKAVEAWLDRQIAGPAAP